MYRIMWVGVLLTASVMAQDAAEIDALLGDTWYGLYLNGEKAGYAMNSLQRDDEGRVTAVEDARFMVNMVGAKQDLRIFTKRIYAADGRLEAIVAQVTDPAGVSDFNARIEGDELVLVSVAGGSTEERRFPAPAESLQDTIKHALWVRQKPQMGDVINFSTFEPMYQQEVAGMSHIVGIEERVLDGVPTLVYQIKTTLDLMGVESMALVAENGTTLEDVISGIIVKRIESEESAKDVNYSSDVIVSNAALIPEPIESPRSMESLRLILRGPITGEHLFNDDRQTLTAEGDCFVFTARRISQDEITRATLPTEDPELLRWTRPTVFVQSEDPRIVEKAKEIIGDEKDPFEASKKICAWVHANMRSTFSARLTNALEVLSSLEGDCTEHSILFIALARAIGIPAREVAGLVYVEGQKPGFYFHQWAKVWVGQWVDMDPTFNQPLVDVTHIKLAEGDLIKQAKLIPVIGNLRIEVAARETETAPDDPAMPESETETVEEGRPSPENAT